ncbi:hypothetical protein GWI33_022355 [Rhynchophorus ferrugineus]|uniref:Uncharacterized protein n=1 Tax=Rhynchophorus ferrugineus TaxID=354439 RepID=A0A834HPV7_RHYFE|nr:hypothetical protein GWI33_022358 [Rhynchophorus ferrugineus]KAF7264790.1 hypothetical protein GWI33_022355 [Rhynchophorus ferrugineus]
MQIGAASNSRVAATAGGVAAAKPSPDGGYRPASRSIVVPQTAPHHPFFRRSPRHSGAKTAAYRRGGCWERRADRLVGVLFLEGPREGEIGLYSRGEEVRVGVDADGFIARVMDRKEGARRRSSRRNKTIKNFLYLDASFKGTLCLRNFLLRNSVAEDGPYYIFFAESYKSRSIIIICLEDFFINNVRNINNIE